MKKNRMMRLASILLILVLMTSSVVGGTFAKYTTSATSNDSARVAKWGFENASSIDITDLFEKAYDGSVNGAVDVIAPGTKNEKTFSFTYDATSNTISAPEVDYTFEVKVETKDENGKESNTTELDKNENFVWTLNGEEYQTYTQLVNAIEDLDGNQTGNKYEAGNLPTNFTEGKTHTIGWEWKFEKKDATTNEVDEEQDKHDTAMGNADVLENVYLKITITATQVD